VEGRQAAQIRLTTSRSAERTPHGQGTEEP
jgi:hypothetical protein